MPECQSRRAHVVAMWDGWPLPVIWNLFQSLVLMKKGLAQWLVPLLLLLPGLVFFS